MRALVAVIKARSISAAGQAKALDGARGTASGQQSVTGGFVPAPRARTKSRDCWFVSVRRAGFCSSTAGRMRLNWPRCGLASKVAAVSRLSGLAFHRGPGRDV